MYTLGQSAKELGISRQALRKWLDKLNIVTLQQGQGLYITEEDLSHIRAVREKNGRPSEKRKNRQPIPSKSPLVSGNHFPVTPNTETLIEELNFLRSQIKVKDEQIIELQKTIDQEQKLHGGTMKQLNDTRDQINLIQNQPSEEVDQMIDLLEKTKDSFLDSMDQLNRSSVPFTVHDGGKPA